MIKNDLSLLVESKRKVTQLLNLKENLTLKVMHKFNLLLRMSPKVNIDEYKCQNIPHNSSISLAYGLKN